MSEYFLATNGVKQGGVLSPFIFSLACSSGWHRQMLAVMLVLFLLGH